jgi:hypothetical protein
MSTSSIFVELLGLDFGNPNDPIAHHVSMTANDRQLIVGDGPYTGSGPDSTIEQKGSCVVGIRIGNLGKGVVWTSAWPK